MDKKFSLNKSTVARLDAAVLSHIQGGYGWSAFQRVCDSKPINCTGGSCNGTGTDTNPPPDLSLEARATCRDIVCGG